MNIDFSNIKNHIVPISDVRLKWRFTDEKYNVLPDIHLSQLKPLDKDASSFLSNFLSKTDLHADIPFKNDFFKTIDQIEVLDENEKDIKKWLYQRGLPFEKEVYLSYDRDNAIIVPWKILIKYFDSFYYPIADDLTVIDESLEWALMFFHEHQIFFGTNKPFTLSSIQSDIDFINQDNNASR